jgi:hypothetical protein
VLRTEIKAVYITKTRPLKNRLSAELCEQIWPLYQSLLFYCNSRSLPKSIVVASVNDL